MTSELVTFLRDFEKRLERQERHTHIFPMPETVIVIEPPGCVEFCDDFERAALGDAWVNGPVFEFGSFTPVIENAIVSGALVGGENNHPPPDTVYGSVRSVAEYPSDQFVEAVVGDLFQGHYPTLPPLYQYMESELFLLTQIKPDSNACLGVYVIIQANQGPGCYMQIMSVDAAGNATYYDDGTHLLDADWESNPDYTIRLETTVAGHCRAFFNDFLVTEDDVAPVGGLHVGVASQWSRTNYVDGAPNTATAPRFELVCGGCLSDPLEPAVGTCPWCDDFERADGPLGADWVAPTPPDGYVLSAFAIDAGAVTGPSDDFPSGLNRWAMTRTAASLDGSHCVEITITDAFQGTPGSSPIDASVELYAQQSSTTAECLVMAVGFSTDASEIFWSVYSRRASPFTDLVLFSGSMAVTLPIASTTLRFEADPDGTVRLFVDGVMVQSGVVVDTLRPDLSGPRAGFGLHWWQNDGGTSPRIEAACTNVAP